MKTLTTTCIRFAAVSLGIAAYVVGGWLAGITTGIAALIFALVIEEEET